MFYFITISFHVFSSPFLLFFFLKIWSLKEHLHPCPSCFFFLQWSSLPATAMHTDLPHESMMAGWPRPSASSKVNGNFFAYGAHSFFLGILDGFVVVIARTIRLESLNRFSVRRNDGWLLLELLQQLPHLVPFRSCSAFHLHWHELNMLVFAQKRVPVILWWSAFSFLMS